MKLKPIVRATSVFAAFFAPVIAFAASVSAGISNSGGFFGISFGSGATCSNTICGIGDTILYLINSVLVPVLFAIAFIVFIYGIAKAYIFSSGEPAEVAKGHKLVLWGIVAFVVMISLWGLVNVAANTFGLAGYAAPALPQSY